MWLNFKLIGCRFHLTQNWFRKVQQLGLVVEYKNKDSPINKYLKTHFGIQFLQPDDALDFFNTEMLYLIPDDPRVRKFRKYLNDNYFCSNALFPPEMWCSSTDFLYRLTNACECFHVISIS